MEFRGPLSKRGSKSETKNEEKDMRSSSPKLRK